MGGDMRSTQIPVFLHDRTANKPQRWIDVESAEWLVASGAANWFRHPQLRTALRETNHKLYNVQRGKHGGITTGPLHVRP